MTVLEDMFSAQNLNFSPHRETNSGLRGVWVYEIGTSPFFSNVAPGEVPELPTEAPPQEDVDAYEESSAARRPLYPDRPVVAYPPYLQEQTEVHPVQFQPQNPEVVEVDDPIINVDGEFMMSSLSAALLPEPCCLSPCILRVRACRI